MSPGGNADNLYTGGFPRVSGDEPAVNRRAEHLLKFSPRERG